MAEPGETTTVKAPTRFSSGLSGFSSFAQQKTDRPWHRIYSPGFTGLSIAFLLSLRRRKRLRVRNRFFLAALTYAFRDRLGAAIVSAHLLDMLMLVFPTSLKERVHELLRVSVVIAYG